MDALAWARGAGLGGGDLLGLAVGPGCVGLAAPSGAIGVESGHDAVAAIDRELRPRWVLWSADTAATLVASGVRLSTSWDVAAVHRVLFGGWRADPARTFAARHGLDPASAPGVEPVDLFSALVDDGDAEQPVRHDGYLRPDWVAGAWARSPARAARWAALALDVATWQREQLGALPVPTRALRTARSESTVELLCAELAADGLPVDRAAAEALVASFVGPRPESDAHARAMQDARDAEVLALVDGAGDIDLRSPGQVKSLLRRAGIEVPDTRAWRLRSIRDQHPVVDAILAWRKAERIGTTYGYRWLDENVGDDGRLRGTWSGCDGAAGRMTASAGLHNLPTALRAAVVAEPGHVFVRADLGQIEPRVLASVSGDAALAAATQDDDMYTPVALDLGVDRPTAKVAVLGAMYGQTTGNGAQVLGRLEAAYPVAMGYLRDADRAAQGSRPLRTYGGRFVDVGTTNANEVSEREARRIAAARGRYGRNAMVQGAAAELFKVWAVLVRARAAPLDARIVLCLHDELLVHAPAERGDDVAAVLLACLDEAVRRWAPDDRVRFVADVRVLQRWSDAKD